MAPLPPLELLLHGLHHTLPLALILLPIALLLGSIMEEEALIEVRLPPPSILLAAPCRPGPALQERDAIDAVRCVGLL